MPDIVSYTQAEPGRTIRFRFVVLDAGVPANPTTLTLSVRDMPTNTEQALLTPVSDGDVGRFIADWSVPAGQAPGFYQVQFTADVGAVSPLSFEVFAVGTFAEQQSVVAAQVRTTAQQLSRARDEAAFVALVRMMLRDHPQLNRLTTGRETSDGEIRAATAMTISIYNSIPPIFSAETRFSNFPSVAWLLIGTVGFILNSSNILRNRNNLQYSDGGITVDTENIVGYGQLAQQWWDRYMQWAQTFKPAENLRRAYGTSPTGLHSEYLMLSSLLGDTSYGGAGVLLQ